MRLHKPAKLRRLCSFASLRARCFRSRKAAYFAQNKTVKTLFDIPAKATVGKDHTVLLEIGNTYAAYTYLNKATATLDGMFYHSFAETDAETDLKTIVANIASTGVQAAVVCSAFPEALLTPSKFFSQDYAVLDAVYGGAEQAHFHDSVPEWQLVNVYAFPQALRRLLDDAFFSVEFYHAYTPVLKIYNGYIADHQILAHFTEQDFRVLVKKDSAVQLAQTYAYKTPLDVVYHLLKLANEFGLSPQSLHLIVSGLIEKDSALYAELRQYFSHLHFTHPPERALADNSHPHHFFTSLFNLASCVS